MEKLTADLIRLIGRHWKSGKIKWFDIFAKQRIGLRRLGIISWKPVDGYFIIDRDRYCELMDGKSIKQMQLT